MVGVRDTVGVVAIGVILIETGIQSRKRVDRVEVEDVGKREPLMTMIDHLEPLVEVNQETIIIVHHLVMLGLMGGSGVIGAEGVIEILIVLVEIVVAIEITEGTMIGVVIGHILATVEAKTIESQEMTMTIATPIDKKIRLIIQML